MTTIDVETDEPRPERPDPRGRRPGGLRRRALVAGLVVAVPVLAVVTVLGIRAAGTTEEDVAAAEAAVSATADEHLAERQGYAFSGGAAGPGEVLSGSSGEAPATGVLDVAVVCASVDARPVQLTVRSRGETVGELTAPCSGVGERDAAPVTTELPAVEITDRWTFDITSESRAVVAVTAS